MKTVWHYDACGEYTDIEGFTVIKQDHPMLLKYEITKEDPETKELKHVDVANSMDMVRAKIKTLIEGGTIQHSVYRQEISLATL